jgi:hypothetical protein
MSESIFDRLKDVIKSRGWGKPISKKYVEAMGEGPCGHAGPTGTVGGSTVTGVPVSMAARMGGSTTWVPPGSGSHWSADPSCATAVTTRSSTLTTVKMSDSSTTTVGHLTFKGPLETEADMEAVEAKGPWTGDLYQVTGNFTHKGVSYYQGDQIVWTAAANWAPLTTETKMGVTADKIVQAAASDDEFEVKCLKAPESSAFDVGERYMAKRFGSLETKISVFDPYGNWAVCDAEDFPRVYGKE